MKLLSYEHDGKRGVAVLDGDRVAPIDGVATMIALLEMGATGLALAEAALQRGGTLSADSVTYLPPVIRPGKVIALGRNYAEHAKEGGAEPPKFPMLFHKTHTALNGHNRPIIIPPGTEEVDFEAELAIIIGKRCKYVSEADALDYVAGYACANDVTARDWQSRTSQFTAGKMVDGFAPLGGCLVTTDEIPDVQNLNIQLWHNGNLMQNSNTRMMIFSVPFTISYISQITTLEVGDVILTGTPEGVGFARKPPVFMQPGDEVVVEIERLGQLKNRFV
jgi:acylpyruvate hydrolase